MFSLPQPSQSGEHRRKVTEFVSNVLVALGSNLPQPEGDPTANLKRALREIAAEGLVIRAISRFFETPCFPAGAGPDYVNACVLLKTNKKPKEVLTTLHMIESRMGRTRDTRWGMRTLDLDLIAVDYAVLPDVETAQTWIDLASDQQSLRAPDELVLPHPRLADRAFVLVPLMDVSPNWRHPLSRLTVAEMLEALPDQDKDAVSPM